MVQPSLERRDVLRELSPYLQTDADFLQYQSDGVMSCLRLTYNGGAQASAHLRTASPEACPLPG
jgi:hypothetical protein